MAARKHLSHDERTRAKIQTSQLINRLNSFVNSKVDLSPAQVTAALGLIKKTLPDLQAITLKGDEENPVYVTQSTRIIKREK
jgi:hypothetical protein